MELLLKELMGYLMAVSKAFEDQDEKKASMKLSREMIQQFEPMMKEAHLNLLQLAYAVGTFHAAVLTEIIDSIEDVREVEEKKEVDLNE